MDIDEFEMTNEGNKMLLSSTKEVMFLNTDIMKCSQFNMGARSRWGAMEKDIPIFCINIGHINIGILASGRDTIYFYRNYSWIIIFRVSITIIHGPF